MDWLKSIILERTGRVIVHESNWHSVPEALHLRKLFDYLRVDCVLDVGANDGQYAGMLRHKARYRGSIVSVEPIPELASRLRAKAKKDSLWLVEECALSDRSGTATFRIMEDTQFSTLSEPRHDEIGVFKEKNSLASEVQVKTLTLEDIIHRLERQLSFNHCFLKLDTQGLDVRILRAQPSALRRFVGLQSEMSIKKLYKDSVDFREALDLYQKLGFQISAIVPNNRGQFPILAEFDCIMIRDDLVPTKLKGAGA